MDALHSAESICQRYSGAGETVDTKSERLARALLWQHRSLLLVATDVVLVAMGCWLAHTVRFDITPLEQLLPIVPHVPNAVVYFLLSAFMTVTWVLLIWKDGGYQACLYCMVPLNDQLVTVLKSAVIAAGISISILFLVRPMMVSRVFLLFALVFAIGLTTLSRVALVMFDRWMGARGIVLNRLIIVGTSVTLPTLVDRLREMRTSLRIAGLVCFHSEEMHTSSSIAGLPLLGTIGDISRIYEENPFNGVLFVANGHDFGCNPELKESIIAAINLCELHGIPFYIVPHSLDVAVSRHEMGSIYGSPVIEIRDASRHTLYKWVKRVTDVIVAALLLIIGLPLWLFIITGIKFTSRGPVFFTQERVGLNGRLFRMFKFRTMVQDAEDRLDKLVDFDSLEEPVFKIENDPRVTRLGRFLRRTGLDEIPQLWNVLKGEMSIIGPRPEQADLVERYNVWQRRRLKGVPGITGYQQVMSRGVPCLSQRIDYDLYYLKHQSFALDVLILLKTVGVVFRGDGIQ
ncbi:MAG: sugar transferase [Desulfomonile tiedjei]|uniref:Sugar transferase n=1 Tax=Desulfomonile tiedjei TaxID=2358 RepID=A0A9D6V3H9_9BACT|nr:sugar transferase [Desulfomonile tiedjei]